MNKDQSTYFLKRAFILGLLIIAFGSTVKSQKMTIVTTGPFTPILYDAFKQNENPKINDTVVKKPELTYTINPKLYQTTFTVEPIKAAKIGGDPLVKFYKSYIRAGFGTKTTPYGEFYFNNLRSTEQSIGFYFRHISSSGKIKNYAFPGYSDNEAAIYASKFYKNHALTGSVDYNRNVVHYYGFNPAENPGISNDSIKQRFSNVAGQIGFKSTYRDSSKVNHSFFLRYSNLSDFYLADESEILFKSAIDKKVKFLGKSINSQDLGLVANVDYFNDRTGVDTSWGAVVKLLPHFSASYDVLKFDIGCNVFIKAADETKVKPFPDLKLDVNLYNNVFILYARLTNDMERNSLRSFSSENPFVNTAFPGFEFTHTEMKFTGGFKGCLGSELSFNANVTQSKIDKLPLFVNDTTSKLMNKFLVIYDNASILNSHIEITYQKSEKFNAMLILNYNKYTMHTEKYAWHKPNSDVKFVFTYNLKDKIILKADVFAYSSTYAKTFSEGLNPTVIPVKLKGAADFNLGLEYRYSKILSAFLNFNNIAAENYKQWYRYPSYGFNVLGGVTYAF